MPAACPIGLPPAVLGLEREVDIVVDGDFLNEDCHRQYLTRFRE